MTTPDDAIDPLAGMRPLLDERLTYPVDLAEVRERLGTTVLAAPDPSESTTIAAVLDRQAGGETFDSADDLFLTICNGLPGAYVGPRFRSGRGVVIDERYESDRRHSF